ncbi:acidic mammalian chitinase-like [Belonocnema kinseyi]|uniref:acidic mammalian chitinase-like n=1 Tax=Belonocnema kinseyi TaxID=2817044 RepID=UPI00143D8C75|nr:acidic mammalian chitinase-like [Belonocnema kinseyi]
MLPLPDEVPAKECEKIIGCYYEINFPDDDGGLLINDIDIHLCTHVFVRYGGIGTNASVEIDEPYRDVEKGLKDFNNLRKKNPKLKTIISMQVEYDESTNNNDFIILTDPNLRENLVNNIIKFVKKYGFNGIDIDYSEPPSRSGHPSEKKNFVLLLKTLRERFDKESLILSVKVDPNEATAKRFYDIKGITTYVNFINLKTYEFHGNFQEEKKVGHTSPIYHSSKETGEERKRNIDYVVKYWISQFAPPSKLILGTTFNGASYTLANSRQIGDGAPTTEEHGQYYAFTGYNQICNLIKKWTYFYDKEQQVPYIYKGNQIIAYDDVPSLMVKAEYAKKMQLGGVMVDSIDDDDYAGACGEKFVLLKTLNRVFRSKC